MQISFTMKKLKQKFKFSENLINYQFIIKNQSNKNSALHEQEIYTKLTVYPFYRNGKYKVSRSNVQLSIFMM
jgi:hypothetical protein